MSATVPEPAPEPAPRPRRTVPTDLAALAAGVSRATIRQWAVRGKLTRHGRPGRPEYDLDEIAAVIGVDLS